VLCGERTKCWGYLRKETSCRGTLGISHQPRLSADLVAKQPGVTARELALVMGVSEKQVHKVTTDLNNAGYISKKREGREFRYSISPDLPFCQDTPQRQTPVWDLLEALDWERERS
jgi:DNA-binding IclR family transcriptional regulator